MNKEEGMFLWGLLIGGLIVLLIGGAFNLWILNEMVRTHAVLMNYCSDLLAELYPR